MKITIIGTGGVGGYFGGRLAKAGNDVTFVARGQHLKALQKTGLTVKSIQGDFHIHPVRATDAIAKTTPADLVIIATKAWQVKDIAHQLLPVIGPNTMVLPLQNGVLSSEELREILPHSNVLSGLCRIISKIEAPGVINHLAVEPTLIFGEYNNSKSERLEPVQATLQKAGFKAFIADDIQAERWKKFISICASGWLAVTGGTYGEVCQQPETHAILHQLYAEVAEVARALGINIPVGFEDKLMAATEAFPFNSTASLTRDVWEGKPSEIEYQNGTVVRLAQKAGIKAPINQFIYYSLLIKERKAREHKTTD